MSAVGHNDTAPVSEVVFAVNLIETVSYRRAVLVEVKLTAYVFYTVIHLTVGSERVISARGKIAMCYRCVISTVLSEGAVTVGKIILAVDLVKTLGGFLSVCIENGIIDAVKRLSVFAKRVFAGR